jgi:hypothetical protein
VEVMWSEGYECGWGMRVSFSTSMLSSDCHLLISCSGKKIVTIE